MKNRSKNGDLNNNNDNNNNNNNNNHNHNNNNWRHISPNEIKNHIL